MLMAGDTSNVTIPSIFTSHTTAHILITLLPANYKFGLPSKRPAPTPSSTPQPAFNLKGEALRTERESAQPSPYPAILKDKSYYDSNSQTDSYPTTKSVSPPPHHEGLWLTLTPGGVSSSPFFDTLLVMVVSPLITLTIVYTMLTIRSHLRRRRWRAPKSYVERLPVRTYHPGSPGPDAQDSCWRSAGTMEEGRGRRGRRRREFRGQSEECVVCLEEYIDGVSRVMKLPCGHEFHEGCM